MTTEHDGADRAAHVGERLSGYLDGELTQQQRQRVRLHLEECAECAKLLDELTALRARLGESDLSGRSDDRWREDMNESGVTLSRGLGWLLLIGAGVIIGAIAVFEFLTEPGLGAGWKVLISAFYLGWLGLFVSVLRQRLIERKTDRYKDVEI
ncbi:MAG: zf-HC2 domain-containing protein [Xanthomonadales bacterium]